MSPATRAPVIPSRPRALFAELMALSGDAGGKPLLTRHARSCHDVPSSAAECLTDIDTREDLARVRGTGAA